MSDNISQIYNDPILGKLRDGSPSNPHFQITETLQVMNGRATLSEIPNRFQKVRVTGYSTELFEINNGELSENLYKVDYVQGVVFFHEKLNYKSLTFTYRGIGAHYFPDSRIYLTEDDKGLGTANIKFKDIDRGILEQKNRVDTLIRENPQPSEVVDLRIDYNGNVFPVARDRINAEQIKIEQAYTDKNGKKYISLKGRIDGEQTKIEDAYKDANNKLYQTLKERIDAEQLKIEEAYKDKNNKLFTSLKNRIDAEQAKIEEAYTDAKGIKYTSLSNRLNKIDENITTSFNTLQNKTDKLLYKSISNETEFIGHRGQSAIAPENTIPSFQLALANGFDSIECDVRFTLDNQPILMHDGDVSRTTNGTGLVSKMTLSAIRGLDASFGMSFFQGTKVPTFDEYLQIAKGRSKYLYPEFKGYNNLANDAKTFVDKIKAHNLEERTVVQSFTATDLAEIRKNSKIVILGYLASTEDVFNLRLDYAEQDGNALVIVFCDVLFLNPSLIKKAFDRGIELITYGTNRSRDIQQLYSYGIRRFICNDKQGVIS